MRIALCNEVLAGMPLQRQCEYAAGLGYDGLEIAPFTLNASPEKISTGGGREKSAQRSKPPASSSPGCIGCWSSRKACR